MKIEHTDRDKRGFFLAIENDKTIGELTYVWRGDNHFVIDHTGVISQYRGHGVGVKLVAAAVKFAKENGYTIYPQCPFVHRIFNLTPAYQEIQKELY
ncbi:MAG: N-acetyltransferase [Bacteroidales bacterium]|jgi:predicted GNAT family acetyltransferase|nr:N-acetyltransferase [Bacteroidales bacterium]